MYRSPTPQGGRLDFNNLKSIVEREHAKGQQSGKRKTLLEHSPTAADIMGRAIRIVKHKVSNSESSSAVVSPVGSPPAGSPVNRESRIIKENLPGIGAGSSLMGENGKRKLPKLPPTKLPTIMQTPTSHDVSMETFKQKVNLLGGKGDKYSPGSVGSDSPSPGGAGGETELSNTKRRFIKQGSRSSDVTSVGGRESVLSIDLNDIYWFGRADIFIKSVDVLLLLFSSYFALLATNFGFLAAYMDFSGLIWLLMLLPAVLALIPLQSSIAYTCMLKSISVLDIECVAKILEEHEEAEKLREEGVEKFVRQMAAQGLHGRAGLKELFDEVDCDKSGQIDQDEFKALLNSQQIFFTKRMFVMLFHVFDTDNSHSISLEELEAVCFPKMTEFGAGTQRAKENGENGEDNV